MLLDLKNAECANCFSFILILAKSRLDMIRLDLASVLKMVFELLNLQGLRDGTRYHWGFHH